MNRIYLIGYMGTGKTTLGKALSEKLGYRFIDLDHYIQELYGKTVAELFSEYGEAGFREIENKTLREVAAFDDAVISTGGGTPCFFDNMDVMNNSGTTVYLKASPEALFNRLSIPEHKEKRPLIKNMDEKDLLQFIAENLAKREAFYEQAHIVFETENLISRDSIDEHIERITQILSPYINKIRQ